MKGFGFLLFSPSVDSACTAHPRHALNGLWSQLLPWIELLLGPVRDRAGVVPEHPKNLMIDYCWIIRVVRGASPVFFGAVDPAFGAELVALLPAFHPVVADEFFVSTTSAAHPSRPPEIDVTLNTHIPIIERLRPIAGFPLLASIPGPLA